MYDKIANSNYAVELGKAPFKFSLVGISGQDIAEGKVKLVLALVWQLMRYNVVSFLSTLEGNATDADILKWANDKVASRAEGGAIEAAPLSSFKDPAVASGNFLLALVAAVEPRAVEATLVTPGKTDADKALNAKYAISCARKLGCTVFLLWEDIVEVHPKMVMVFVATLMAHATARTN